MGMIAGIAGIASGIFGAKSSRKAADQQSDAAQAQLDFSRQVYRDQKQMFAPYRQMGMQGQQAYNSLLGLGDAPKGFGGYQRSPGYDWQMSQGQDAIQSAAAAQGGLYSGKTLQDLGSYGQGLANQDYQTYLNRLQGIGAQGQAAAGMQSGAAQQYGQNALGALGSMGDARASGTIGGYNALMGGLNTGLQGFGYMQGMGQQSGGFSGGLSSLFGGGGMSV